MNKYVFSLLFVSSLAIAQDKAPSSLLAPVPAEVKPNEIVVLKPIDGHHFNLKAPHSCDKGIQVEFTARVLKCQFTKEGTRQLQVGICDDPETFCKIESVTVQVGKQTVIQQETKPVETKIVQKEVEGFITNDITKAVATAKKEKKLLLVDLFANWCPPCFELEEYVFSNASFADASKNFIKLRVDHDLPIAWEFDTKYKIVGLPTLMVIDPQNMQEIGRTMGSHSVQAVVAWLADMEKLKGKSIDWAKKQNSEKQKVRVARWYWDRGDNQKAFDHLKKVKGDEAMLLRLMIVKDLAWANADQIKYKDAMKQLIENFPYDIRVGSWTSQLLEADLEMGKKYTDRAFKALDMWRKSQKLSQVYDIDYDIGGLWATEGEIYNLIGDKEKAKNAYVEASKYLEEKAKSSSFKMSKGTNLDRAYYLEESGKKEDSLKLYKKLAETYPDEFIFNYRYARALSDQKEYKKALKFANAAEKQSYGDNLLRIVAVKAKILINMNKKPEAKKLIEDTLSNVELPKTSDAWTHGRVQSLRSILAEIN